MADRKKPWSGRFQKPTAKNVEKFTSSIHYDQRLYLYDIKALLLMYNARRSGIISADEAAKL